MIPPIIIDLSKEPAQRIYPAIAGLKVTESSDGMTITGDAPKLLAAAAKLYQIGYTVAVTAEKTAEKTSEKTVANDSSTSDATHFAIIVDFENLAIPRYLQEAVKILNGLPLCLCEQQHGTFALLGDAAYLVVARILLERQGYYLRIENSTYAIISQEKPKENKLHQEIFDIVAAIGKITIQFTDDGHIEMNGTPSCIARAKKMFELLGIDVSI